MSDLPQGWAETSLGQVCELLYGKGLPKNQRKKGSVHVYGSNGVVGQHDTPLVNEPGIIIGRKGSHGEINISETPFWPIDTSYFIPYSQCSLNYNFLIYLLKSIDLKKLNRSSAIPGLNREEAYKVNIKIPPLKEQARIAQKLDVIFERYNDVKNRINLISDHLDKLLQSIFDAACTGQLIGLDSKSIQYTRLSKLSTKPQYGFTTKTNVENSNSLLLRITDIQNRSVNWDKVPKCKCDDQEKYKLRRNDIVFARTGATVGKSYLIESPPSNAIFASYLIRVVPGENLNPKFLYYFFQSGIYWNQINDQATGTGQPNVNGTKLANLKIPKLDIEQQNTIVNLVETKLHQFKKISEAVKSSMKKVNKAEQAILKIAFEGKLLKQNSNDEPAQTLLNQISEKRQSSK